jgi:hypothetical protein
MQRTVCYLQLAFLLPLLNFLQPVFISSYQPFAADTARVILKNLGASLCNTAKVSAASSCALLLQAFPPDQKVAFWECVKQRLDERLEKEGNAEVLRSVRLFWKKLFLNFFRCLARCLKLTVLAYLCSVELHFLVLRPTYRELFGFVSNLCRIQPNLL